MPEPSRLAVEHPVSWVPSWIGLESVEHARVLGAGPPCIVARPRLDAWSEVTDGLKSAGRALRELTVADRVEAIGLAAERWADRDWPERVAARDAAAAATGFACEVVDRSFDVELRNYRADSLWRALRRELGDPAVLDGPRPDRTLQGRTMAVGPDLTAAIFTGNVPGLPALSIVRSLLVGSAVVAKVASGEPTFAARFAASLAAVEQRLGDAVLVTYWERDDLDTRDAVLSAADVVVSYGSDEACAAIRAALGPSQRFVEHAHRLSLGVLSRAFLEREEHERIAGLVARDASMFNQQACIAPHAYLLEGNAFGTAGFAERVARAMDDYARDCPLGELTDEQAQRLALRRAEAVYVAAESPPRLAWALRDATVLVEEGIGPSAASGYRTLRLVPVPDLAAALEMLRPYGRQLQNVAVGATDGELEWLSRELARLGASRISAPGSMAEPSFAWRHDGRSCIAELVRWCDVESHPWARGTLQVREREGSQNGTGQLARG